jgi:replicative DNA helicase
MTAPPVPDAVLEAERAVLSATFLEPEGGAVLEAAEILRPDHFGVSQHRLIWTAMTELRQASRPVDPVTVGDQLRSLTRLEQAGGMEYVTELLGLVGTAKNAVAYAGMVRDRALERRLGAAAQGILAAIAQRSASGQELAALAERDILEASTDLLPNTPRTLKEIAWTVAEAIERRSSHPQHVLGVPTGIPALDDLTAGWRDGNLIVLAGRPSVGKSALALHFASQAAHAGIGALVLSLEMGREEVVERMLATMSGVDGMRLRRAHIRADEWPKLSSATGALARLPVWIDDTPDRSVSAIRAITRRYRRQHGIGLVVLDYLQLVHADRPRENQTQNVADISRGLKAMARELAIPVLAASQLSRATEAREDRRPRLADLRDSGAIEQDADLVLLLWQDPQLQSYAAPPLTVLLEKQRNGPIGTMQVYLERATGQVTGWERRDGEDAAA